MRTNETSAVRTPKQSRSLRDQLAGTEALRTRIPMPEFIVLTDPDVRRHFASLKNETQRRAYLDALMRMLDHSIESWTTFYEAVSLLRNHRPYWRKQGYGTFAAFWRDRAGPTFQALKELEDIYAYARLACPEYGGSDSRSARRLRSRVEVLATPVKLKRIPVSGGKRVFESKDDASKAIAHAFKWSMVSNRSFEYRLYRIKRDRQDVAAHLLAGKFTVRLDSGLYAIDLIRAERAVYGATYGMNGSSTVAKTSTETHALDTEKKRIKQEIQHLVKASAQSSAYQRYILEQLRAIPWLAREFKASP
ncbi:hypothetical protein JOD97_001102 [Duganella sp. 1411]|jgi:hypothetical protein|uniref:hypothetical protein n=1 Tax=Duganella sp. 1411 TaxID=2806572 RepID=UPI001AE101F9|nr:hypothetical protein [Duganella sp. 1411]MBP1203088.1 hypothetical protein [Duganella sp. 1411]